MAHPLRLRMLSLLTGAAMSAAEVARELDITQANASYHLRNLERAGMLVVAERVNINGGQAKRYRHDPLAPERHGVTAAPEDRSLFWRAVAAELVRRSTQAAPVRRRARRAHMTDAELWVDPDTWRDVVARIQAASKDLHAAAQPPHAKGTIRTSSTLALFEMERS